MDTTGDEDVVRGMVGAGIGEQVHHRRLEVSSVTNTAHRWLVSHDFSQMGIFGSQIVGHVGQHVAITVVSAHYAIGSLSFVMGSPRGDAVDTDPESSQLNTKSLSQSNNSALAGAVVARGLTLARYISSDGGNEDNRPAARVGL